MTSLPVSYTAGIQYTCSINYSVDWTDTAIHDDYRRKLVNVSWIFKHGNILLGMKSS